MKKVYFISGLGADKRAFSFLDLSFCEPIFIDWIPPLKNESLESYASRLRKQITDPSPVIVGVSFGGMLATEMAKANPSIRCIIISSNKIKKEFPSYFMSGKYLPLYKWVPAWLMRKPAFIQKIFLQTSGAEQVKIFKEIAASTDDKFTRWAIHAILHWKNATVPGNIIHIHGTADRLLPYRLVKADYTIEKGNHLMIMNNHEEIAALLKKLI